MGTSGEHGVTAEVAAIERGIAGVLDLSGTYRHQVDGKGRVAVPSPLRRWLPEGSKVAPGPQRSLIIWAPEAWRRLVANFRRMAEAPRQDRDFLRKLVGNTYPFEVDAQGRMLLSAWQRGWTGIVDRAVFVGMGDGVEVTAETVWEQRGGDLDPAEFDRLHDLAVQRGRTDGGPGW